MSGFLSVDLLDNNKGVLRNRKMTLLSFFRVLQWLLVISSCVFFVGGKLKINKKLPFEWLETEGMPGHRRDAGRFYEKQLWENNEKERTGNKKRIEHSGSMIKSVFICDNCIGVGAGKFRELRRIFAEFP